LGDSGVQAPERPPLQPREQGFIDLPLDLDLAFKLVQAHGAVLQVRRAPPGRREPVFQGHDTLPGHRRFIAQAAHDLVDLDGDFAPMLAQFGHDRAHFRVLRTVGRAEFRPAAAQGRLLRAQLLNQVGLQHRRRRGRAVAGERALDTHEAGLGFVAACPCVAEFGGKRGDPRRRRVLPARVQQSRPAPVGGGPALGSFQASAQFGDLLAQTPCGGGRRRGLVGGADRQIAVRHRVGERRRARRVGGFHGDLDDLGAAQGAHGQAVPQGGNGPRAPVRRRAVVRRGRGQTQRREQAAPALGGGGEGRVAMQLFRRDDACKQAARGKDLDFAGDVGARPVRADARQALAAARGLRRGQQDFGGGPVAGHQGPRAEPGHQDDEAAHRREGAPVLPDRPQQRRQRREVRRAPMAGPVFRRNRRRGVGIWRWGRHHGGSSRRSEQP
jgi:hypothetical protein